MPFWVGPEGDGGNTVHKAQIKSTVSDVLLPELASLPIGRSCSLPSPLENHRAVFTASSSLDPPWAVHVLQDADFFLTAACFCRVNVYRSAQM
jgi:hypothetical protein